MFRKQLRLTLDIQNKSRLECGCLFGCIGEPDSSDVAFSRSLHRLTLALCEFRVGPNLSNECGSSAPARVYLLTESRLLRETLARQLQKRAGISVAGTGREVESAMAEIGSVRTGIVLTDLLSTSHDTGCIGNLIEQFPQIKILLFGMDEDPELFLKAVSLGISGYLLKEASATEIVAAVRAVAQGEAACSPRLCMVLMQHLAEQTRVKSHLPEFQVKEKCPLTHRQLQLVELVAKGMSNKEIAASLNLSEFTVKNHIHRIMRQVNADDRHQVVDFVRAAGSVPSI